MGIDVKATNWRALLLAGAGLLALAVASAEALGAANVLERGYDSFRTGANIAETVLTPANVRSSANQFHKRFTLKVDGKIEGSPLYRLRLSGHAFATQAAFRRA